MAADFLRVIVVDDDGCDRIEQPLGRNAWALRQLIAAGRRGCTPIDNPAPRWSAYIFKLRHVHGIAIETVWEGHEGRYAGRHARYVLTSKVRLLGRADAA